MSPSQRHETTTTEMQKINKIEYGRKQIRRVDGNVIRIIGLL